jgi:hypothetical protein
MYGVAFAGAVLLVESPLAPFWRALLFFPFLAAGVLVFQAAYGICPMRAARGEREANLHVERVASPLQRAHDKRRVLNVFSSAALSAALATALLLWLP